MTTRSLQIVAFGVLVVLLIAGSVDAQLAWFDPTVMVIVFVGGNADLTARVIGIPDLWGVDFWVTYDPSLLNMADPIVEGVCPAPQIPLANTVDNVAGVGHYAVSAITAGPCDTVTNPNQVAAVFNFTRVAIGISPIDFSLVDPPGVSVMANGSVEVCNASTPGCWQHSITDVPVELMSVSLN